MTEMLFKKDVKIRKVTTIGHPVAQAVGDPIRIRILEILNHKQMSAQEIVKALGSSGYKKATTTIRHHLDTLKSAGLIEAGKMVEVRGAVMKYYGPTLRAFSYETPDLENHSKLVNYVGTKLLKIMRCILEDKKFNESFDGKKTCNQCRGDHYREYGALEILNAATANLIGRKEFIEMVVGTGQRTK